MMPHRWRAAGFCCAAAWWVVDEPLAVQTEFRDPAAMTHQERQTVHAARGEYQDCMRRQIQAALLDSDDPLQLADAAMKQCVSILERLHSDVTAMGYSPEVAGGFVRGISRRGAREALGELMQIMALREASQADAGANAEADSNSNETDAQPVQGIPHIAPPSPPPRSSPVSPEDQS